MLTVPAMTIVLTRKRESLRDLLCLFPLEPAGLRPDARHIHSVLYVDLLDPPWLPAAQRGAAVTRNVPGWRWAAGLTQA